MSVDQPSAVPTPRTDAVAKHPVRVWSENVRNERRGQPQITEVVPADEMRRLEREHAALCDLTRVFFSYLDCVEESEFGREFHPLTFSCCRAGWTEDIDRILREMKAAAIAPVLPAAETPAP